MKKCGKEEFFGLRDFYSLVKMVYAIAAKSGQIPRWHQLEHAIKRNFGGLTEQTSLEIFKRYFQDAYVSSGHYTPLQNHLLRDMALFLPVLTTFTCSFLYKEDEETEPSTTIRLIEASLRREDVADQSNFR